MAKSFKRKPTEGKFFHSYYFTTKKIETESFVDFLSINKCEVNLTLNSNNNFKNIEAFYRLISSTFFENSNYFTRYF